MKSQQEKPQGSLSAKTIRKILSFVIIIGTIKVFLLFGVMFFPSEIPSFNFITVAEYFTDKKATQPNDNEMRKQARLKAQGHTLAELNLVQPQQAKENIKNPFATQEAHAAPEEIAPNTPPSVDPNIANPNPSPLIPQVKPMSSSIVENRILRPDSASAGALPAPAVQNPYALSDSSKVQQEELNRRERELRALQQQLETRVSELRGIEDKLETAVGSANEENENKLTHLINVYTNMKPRQAAAALAKLDEKVAVQILSGMKGKQAGVVLSSMETERAVVLSELLSKVAL